MSGRDKYQPGPAAGAHVDKEGGNWTLVLVRELRHPPARVWAALTDPEQLREWAPFDADRNLATVGAVRLTTAGMPSTLSPEGQVQRAEPGKLLEFTWGGKQLRWQLEPLRGGGTRLTLWHNIDRSFIAMGAAGWHICLEVLDLLLAGEPIGRLVAAEPLAFPGWQRLHSDYARQFGVAPPDSIPPRS